MALFKYKVLLPKVDTVFSAAVIEVNKFHTCSQLLVYQTHRAPKGWLQYNKKIYPPQNPNENPRPAVSSKTIFKSLVGYKIHFSLSATNELILSIAHGKCGTLQV